MRPLYTLVMLVALSSGGYMAARFAVLLFAAQIPLSAALVGLLAAMFAVVSAFASVHTGRLIDRRGSKLPLLWSTGILAIVVALGAIWRGLPMLFAIAVITGLAHNTMVLAFQRLAGELSPANERAAAFGLLGLGFSFANLGAPVAAGFAIEYAGFTATFVIFALVPVLSFLIVWTDRLPWPPVHAAPAGIDAKTGVTLQARTGTLGLLRSPRLSRLYFSCGLFEAAWMGFGFMLPIHGTQLGLGASDIGMIAGAAAVLLVLSRLFMPRVLRRFAPWQLLIAGMLFIGTGFVGFAQVTTFAWLAAFGAVVGLGQGLAGPMLNALIYEQAPAHEAGEAMGLRTLINNVSQGGLPLIAGALGAALGLAPVFWALAIGMFGTAWSSRAHWIAAERAYHERRRERQRAREHTRPPP